MKKCLISGISGFVGKYLADFLTKKNYEVSGFDRRGSVIPKVNISKIDILDKEAVKNFIKEIKPDYIIHLAAQSSVKKSWDNPEETITINVEGTRNLLEGVIAAGIVPQCKILIFYHLCNLSNIIFHKTLMACENEPTPFSIEYFVYKIVTGTSL